MGESAHSVVVLGDVGGQEFHVGDEAMVDANVARLEDAGAVVTVLGRDAGPTAIAAALAGADGALLSGGGNLSDTWPALLEQRIVFLEDAARRSLPVVAGGQTIGPDLSAPLRGRLAAALSRAALFGVREQPSLALALELGLDPERVVLQADDAFGLKGSPPADPTLLALAEQPFLAVTLDGSYAVPELRPAVQSLAAQVAAAAIELSLPILFVPHVGVIGERSGDDPRAGALFAALVRLAGATCHEAPVRPAAETAWLARRATLTVSSRYHPIVFATAAGRPCVGLHRDGYTRAKLVGALAHVGAERWCLDTVAAEEGALLPMLRTLWAERSAVAEVMARERAGVEERERVRRARLLAELGLASPAALPSPS